MLERALRAVAGGGLSADSPGARGAKIPSSLNLFRAGSWPGGQSPGPAAAEDSEGAQPGPVLREAAVGVGIE
eukprot:10428553-Alexandrium_andersonii.AAC.1